MSVELYWIPLGAGGRSVRFNGKVYEALVAARRHRPRRDLYHAALMVELDRERYTIEVAPSPDADVTSRGVVATGLVGSRLLGWWRLFRYEVRCWRDGSIPDLAHAVGGPQRVSRSPAVARRLLVAARRVPTPVWGRDELRTGDMWTSNSVAAWLIVTAGVPAGSVQLPEGGRAPGWDAGIEVASRRLTLCSSGERAPLILGRRSRCRHDRLERSRRGVRLDDIVAAEGDERERVEERGKGGVVEGGIELLARLLDAGRHVVAHGERVVRGTRAAKGRSRRPD